MLKQAQEAGGCATGEGGRGNMGNSRGDRGDRGHMGDRGQRPDFEKRLRKTFKN